MKRLACVLLVVGCGGSARPQTTTGIAAPPPRSACAVAADHVAQVVLTFRDAPKAPVAELAKIIASHCETDAWSADSIQCWKGISTETDAEKCSKVLTEDQHQKVFADVIKKYGDTIKDSDGSVPVEAPPPPTKGDPCGGGE